VFSASQLGALVGYISQPFNAELVSVGKESWIGLGSAGSAV
jgi:hypothetical protein